MTKHVLKPPKTEKEENLTERLVIRVTPEQLALIKEVSPDPRTGGVSYLWRWYILILAGVMKNYRIGIYTKEQLKERIEKYALDVIESTSLSLMMETHKKEHDELVRLLMEKEHET